jgi:hypothetical protein
LPLQVRAVACDGTGHEPFAAGPRAEEEVDDLITADIRNLESVFSSTSSFFRVASEALTLARRVEL